MEVTAQFAKPPFMVAAGGADRKVEEEQEVGFFWVSSPFVGLATLRQEYKLISFVAREKRVQIFFGQARRWQFFARMTPPPLPSTKKMTTKKSQMGFYANVCTRSNFA